ncbi:hypothetical protein RZE82_07055 [Mollicutes bacterium LVI A0039]|nr:hypothetical protein RZE82_07055 [Mollicutes bacterium LVI A0039]
MEAFVSIAFINWLLKIVGFVVGVWQLWHIAVRGKQEYASKGPRGIWDEVLIGLLIMGLIGFICSDSGLSTIGNIVDQVIAIGLKIIKLILEFLNGSF